MESTMDRRQRREEFGDVMHNSDVSETPSTRVAVSTEYMGIYNGVAACGGPSGKSPLLSLNPRAFSTAPRKE
jgi:hypothetical protein